MPGWVGGWVGPGAAGAWKIFEGFFLKVNFNLIIYRILYMILQFTDRILIINFINLIYLYFGEDFFVFMYRYAM